MPPNPAVGTSESDLASIDPPPRDRARLQALGAQLASRFTQYESARRLQEMKWMRNLRQFLGEYDPEIKIDKDRSQAYPRITRVKCISFLSRMMNLLFPLSEKNWGIEASPVPNLSMDDLSQVLTEVFENAKVANQPADSNFIEQAIRDFAGKRAINLEREIADQLSEVGGNRNLNYVALCRKVLMSGILYGAGVLKGPFTRVKKRRTWSIDNGRPVPHEDDYYCPQFEFVPLWEYYPDMTAKHLYQMDGQFHRMIVSKSQLRELADRDDFFGDTITSILDTMPQGNFKERSFETDLRTHGTSTNLNPNNNTKFEIIIWDGYISKGDLTACGVAFPANVQKDMSDASIWMIGNQIIKGGISPWAELEPDERVQTYHVFVFEEDDTNLLGNGLPNIMRDSQMSIAASSRMLLDNASVTCGPMIEMNTDLLKAGQDLVPIGPYAIFRREGMGAEAQWPAVRNIDIDSHIPDLSNVVKMFMDFADRETFVGPATGGDMSDQPSEPMRTAAGASMLHGMAALPFKDAVRNFDIFTTSVINSLVLFNKHFNQNPDIKGDFQPVARGSSSLIAKEVRGMALDNLAQTLQPEERQYLRWPKLLAERLKVRDIDIANIVVSDIEAHQIDQAAQQKAQQQTADMREMFMAEVRKTLADAVKSLTQADANSNKADAATQQQTIDMYNTVLKGLESGVTPSDVHAANAGAQLPAAIAAGFRRTSGKDKPQPAASTVQ